MEKSTGQFNIPSWTLGGKQLWTDFVQCRGWRIQQNALTHHFRLIDPRNVRQAWGTREQCQNQLDAVRSSQHLEPTGKPILLLLHGLGRSRNSMSSLAKALADGGGYEVINVSYASTRASLDEHAAALQSVLEQLPADSKIDVVAHSLGCLVVRRYLAIEKQRAIDSANGPQFHRIVMLGPPNNGAELAKKLQRTGLVGIVLGDSARQVAQLKTTPEIAELAIPRAEFGIIAGNGGIGPISNPLLRGENDLFVEVAETKLPGAADFLVVNSAHGLLLEDATVHQAAASFLANGYFRSADQRQPLPK